FIMKLMSVCLFATWKYSMGREDFFHAIIFMYLLVLIMILFTIVQKQNVLPGIFLFLSAICFYNFNLQYVPNYINNYYWYPGVINFNDRVIHQRAFKEKMLEQSKQY